MDYIPIDTNEIVVTAARAPEAASDSAASVTIFDKKRIERLGEPMVPVLLRLAPSTAVACSGGTVLTYSGEAKVRLNMLLQPRIRLDVPRQN